MDGENGDKGGENFASGKNSIHGHSKHPFSEAAFVGDLSIFRNINCWASAPHQVTPEGSENWG